MDNSERVIRWQARWLLGPLIAFLLLAIFLPHPIWSTLTICISLVLAIGYWWVHILRDSLFATRQLRFGWISVGDRLEETLTLVNTGWVPALWVEVVDESNVPGYTARVVQSVGIQEQSRWRRSAVCLQRGQFHLGPWSLITTDPFGLFELTVTYPITEEIIIHPPIHTQLPVQLPSGRLTGRARARTRALQATINAAAVREYQPTDPPRWIHWPTSARREQLFVREFDLDAAGDMWILIDNRPEMQFLSGPEGTEEHAVILAAALAMEALLENRPVGLAAYGQEPTIVPAAKGDGQQWKLLRALALLQADGTISLTAALEDLRAQLRRGAAVVLITPDFGESWIPEMAALIHRGVQATVILFDPISFGQEGNAEPLRMVLRRLGAETTVLQQGDVGRAPEMVRRGFVEYRVTPFGGVVAIRGGRDE